MYGARRAGLRTTSFMGHGVAPRRRRSGFCNTMGTASTMNSAGGSAGHVSFPARAAIPGALSRKPARSSYADRQAHRRHGARKNLRPSKILTKEAFHNAIVVNSAALGGSTNCAHPYLVAIARHMGVDVHAGRIGRPPRPQGAAAGQPASPPAEYLGEGLPPCRRRACGGDAGAPAWNRASALTKRR